MINKIKVYYFLSIILIIVLIEIIIHKTIHFNQLKQSETTQDFNLSLCPEKTNIDFTKIKWQDKINQIGLPFDIVPNIVHYVLFTIHEIQFGHFISILSALKNQRPDLIYIHCDCHQLSGYYQRVLKVANKTNTQIIIRTIDRPTKIFGKKLNEKWLNWHLSDITRNRVLQEFGGIYLDRDIYVVKPLNEFFKYEMTIEWGDNRAFATPVLIAHKNARFLKLWLNSYHQYKKESWYYNAGVFPTNSILKKQPDLVHRVKTSFGFNGPKINPWLYGGYFKNWNKAYYAIHFTMRGNQISFEKEKYPLMVGLNEQMVYHLNVTFGEMARILFDFEKQVNLENKLT